MITKKMYRYLGRNGIITSEVKLEQISPIPMIQLKAEYGKLLTNGVEKVHSVVVFEDEVENWTEVENTQ